MYKIITDSSWDMNNLANELEVEVVPFQINLDGTGASYKKEYIEITAEEIYQFMVEHPGVYPKSAQPSMDDYYKVFKKVAEEGNDILCFTLSAFYCKSAISNRFDIISIIAFMAAAIDSSGATVVSIQTAFLRFEQKSFSTLVCLVTSWSEVSGLRA